MNTRIQSKASGFVGQPAHTRYEAPRLEVHRLCELPSALANSGAHCHVTPSKTTLSCSGGTLDPEDV